MPDITELEMPFAQSRTKRSPEKSWQRLLRATEHNLHDYLKYAPIFQVPMTLEALQDRPKNTDPEIKKAQDICDELASMPPQVFSGRFVDKEGRPICMYLGHRWKSDKVCGYEQRPVFLNTYPVKCDPPASPQSYESQYIGRMSCDLKQGQEEGRACGFDGIPVCGLFESISVIFTIQDAEIFVPTLPPAGSSHG